MVLPLLVGIGVAIGTGAALTQTRAGEFSADIGGRSLTAEQIYSSIRGGVGNGDLMLARDVADGLVERYSERSGQLNALVAKLDAAWQGNAADAAATHVTPLDRAFQESMSSLQRAKDALHNQIDSFSHIYTAVQPVPADPPQSGLLNDINPFTTDTDRAINEYNEKAANNVARYESYNQDSMFNGRQMQARYPSLPLDVPPISVSDASNDGRVGTYTSDGSTEPSVVSATDTGVPHERTANPGPVTTAPDLRGQNQVSPPPTGSDGGTTRASQVVPAPPSTPGESGQAIRNPVTTGPSVGPVPSVTGVPQVQRTGTAARRDARGVGGTGGGAGRTGAGTGTGRAGGGSGAGRTGGGLGGGDSQRNTSGQPGRGPTTGVDAANSVRRGGVPIAGAAGTAAGSATSPYGAPPGRTRDDDDIEHKSVLIQPDPHELFGLQALTPPAVIGEDEAT